MTRPRFRHEFTTLNDMHAFNDYDTNKFFDIEEGEVSE
jgi:hypothetical protein